MKTLLDHGANPNTKKITRHVSKQGDVTEFGDKIRPLHLAARYGALNIVNLLLADARVVVDVYNANHQTPLHFAAMYDQPEIAITLIDRYTSHYCGLWKLFFLFFVEGQRLG